MVHCVPIMLKLSLHRLQAYNQNLMTALWGVQVSIYYIAITFSDYTQTPDLSIIINCHNLFRYNSATCVDFGQCSAVCSDLTSVIFCSQIRHDHD